MKKILILLGLVLLHFHVYAQDRSDTLKLQKLHLDSLFIQEIEQSDTKLKPKVLHAEPLYIDLIRDLGARKGEKEWNVAFGLQHLRTYDEFHALVEYEWAPIDRLGFEVEVPLTIYSFPSSADGEKKPGNRLESLKLASQYTFFVSEKLNTSMAFGYIHEFELEELNQIGKEKVFRGNVFNPFFVVAKRWGSNYHTLIYTGPKVEKPYHEKAELHWEANYNFHYMLSGTRNFIGLEVNQTIHHGIQKTTLRPQMRLGLAENLMVGIVSVIPIGQPEAGFGSFVRLIYEPGFHSIHTPKF